MKVTDKWGQRERDVVQQESRRADTVGSGDDTQTQGSKKKNMLVSRTKNRHELHSLGRVNHSIRYSVSYLQRTSFCNRCFASLLVV